MPQHARKDKTGSPTLCFKRLFWFSFLFFCCMFRWPDTAMTQDTTAFQPCTAKHQRQRERERWRCRKCSPHMFLQHFLNHFITSYQWQVIAKQSLLFLSNKRGNACTRRNVGRRSLQGDKTKTSVTGSWILCLGRMDMVQPLALVAMGFHSPPPQLWREEPACWVTATRKHAENRPAMLQAATTACLPVRAQRTSSAYWLDWFPSKQLCPPTHTFF